MAAVVAVLLPTAPARATQAVSVGGSLSAVPTGSVIVGEQVRLTGSLPPAKARKVTLQRQIGNGKWTNVGSKVSSGSGGFAFVVTVPKTVNTTVRYRVFTPAAKLGGTRYAAVQTRDVTLRTVGQTASLAGPGTAAAGSTFTLTAAFAPPRPDRPVLLQRRAGSKWVTAGQGIQRADGTVVFTVAAGPVGTGSYRVQAKKWLGAPAVTSPIRTVVVVAAGDTRPPAVPRGLAAAAGDGRVELSWKRVVAADLAGYRVYRATDAAGPWELLGQVSGEAFSAGDLVNGTGYWFRVSSVDGTGNESAASAAVPATPQGTAPPVPVLVLPADIAAEATGPNGAVVSFTATATDLVGGAVPVTCSSDSGSTFAVGQTVVSCSASNDAGQVSGSFTVTVASDSTPPAVPTGLTAIAFDGYVHLAWESVSGTPAETVTYRVYVYTSGGELTQIVEGSFPSVWFLLDNGTPYTFVVASVDWTGNVSEPSAEVTATPSGDTPPAVPPG